MVTEKHNKSTLLYANLMQEVKIRTNQIHLAMSGATGLPGPFVNEFCCLQIRLICELIALGCLVLHGDIEETTKLHKKWAANEIIGALEALHPEFFPRSCNQQRTGHNSFHIEYKQTGFLSKKELLEIYGRCGDVLHKGSVKKLLNTNVPIQKSFPSITDIIDKITTLLNVHEIPLINEDQRIICMMRELNLPVQVAFTEAIKEPSPPLAVGQ